MIKECIPVYLRPIYQPGAVFIVLENIDTVVIRRLTLYRLVDLFTYFKGGNAYCTCSCISKQNIDI